MNPATLEQPAPVPNDGPAIWDLVIADVTRVFDPEAAAMVLPDMRARDAYGTEHYGTRLQANNGLDPVVDAYQEALDLAAYLRQAIAQGREDLMPTYGMALGMVVQIKRAMR